MFKLYYHGEFLGQYDDIEDARAQARWAYFEYRSQPWEGEHTPPGFMISVECVFEDAA